MPEITVIMATARHSYPIIGMPNTHIFQPTIQSLKKQSFKDFELVIADTLHHQRPDTFKGNPFNPKHIPFTIKHIPLHPNHSFWAKEKRWHVCEALNTCLLHAEGELIVRIDDCSEIPSENYLETLWQLHQSDLFPLTLHTRYRNGRQAYLNEEYLANGYDIQTPSWEDPNEKRLILLKTIGYRKPVRDSRWEIVEANGGQMIAPHNWVYGYTAVPLKVLLKINGFDERFDGQKSLEDVDLGSRIEMAGYKNKFYLSTKLWIIEHEHEAIPSQIIDPNKKPIVCNYALYLLNRRNNWYRANTHKLSPEDINFIKQETLRPPCSPKPNFYQDNLEGEDFKKWLNHQPIFNLEKERRKTQ